MLFLKASRNLLFILFLVYMAQEWLYTSGSALSQVCVILIILISGFFIIKTLLLDDTKQLVYIAWTLFVLMNVLVFILSPDLEEGFARESFKNTMGCMLPFYPFYYFTVKGVLKKTHLLIFSILLLIIYIFRFHMMETYIVDTYGVDDEAVVNNIAYSFLALLPYVFLFREKKIISGLMLLLIMFYIIQSSKRGAIIAGVTGMLLYSYSIIKLSRGKHGILNAGIIVFLLVGIGLYTRYLIVHDEFLLYRLSEMLEGDNSERTWLYTSILRGWFFSDNLFNMLFGWGIAGSVKFAGDLAHNDWLEVLSNFGIIGLFFYGFLLYILLKTAIRRIHQQDKKIMLLTILVLWFFISLVSMWYTSFDYFACTILIAYILGDKEGSEIKQNE